MVDWSTEVDNIYRPGDKISRHISKDDAVHGVKALVIIVRIGNTLFMFCISLVLYVGVIGLNSISL